MHAKWQYQVMACLPSTRPFKSILLPLHPSGSHTRIFYRLNCPKTRSGSGSEQECVIDSENHCMPAAPSARPRCDSHSVVLGFHKVNHGPPRYTVYYNNSSNS